MSDDLFPFNISIKGWDDAGFQPLVTVRGETADLVMRRYKELVGLLHSEVGFAAEPAGGGAAVSTIVEFDAYALMVQDGKPYFALYSQQPGWSKFATMVWPERMPDLPFAPTGNEKEAQTTMDRERMMNGRLLHKFPTVLRLRFPAQLDETGEIVKNEKGYTEWDKRKWTLVSPALSPEQAAAASPETPDLNAPELQPYNKIVNAVWKADTNANSNVPFRMLSWCRKHWHETPKVSIKLWADLIETLNEFYQDASAAETIFAVLAGVEIDEIAEQRPSKLVYEQLDAWHEKEAIGLTFRTLQTHYSMSPEI